MGQNGFVFIIVVLKMALIQIQIERQIATVTLNRPEKKNALDLPMFLEIDRSIRRLQRDCSVRVVILNANGDDFCTGLDIRSVMGSPINALRLLWKWLPGNANLAQRVSVGWRRLPVPVIAVIQGRCWGGGMQIALGADKRIAHSQASLSIMEARWGLIPDMGGTLSLRENVCANDALHLAMSAQELTAEEAKSLGLIDSVSPDPMADALQLAQSYLKFSPDAIAAVKKLYRKAWAGNERQILAKESWYQLRVLLGRNQRIMVKRQKDSADISFEPRGRW